MSTKAERKTARKGYEHAKKTTPPGEGSRFAALEKVAKMGGAKNPGAVAAAIGRKKYGPAKFAKMAAAGKKNK
jgi:hypothetical protein